MAMMIAMPLVKPMMTGYGMNLMTLPRRAIDIATSRAPAMIVAMARPA